MAEAERHGREGYYIVGEGLMGAPEVPAGTARAMSMEADLRAFRFSRMGPKGRQLPDPLRRRVGAAMTNDLDARKLDSSIPSGFTYLGQFLDHDLTFDKSTAARRRQRPGRRPHPGALAEPRPRLPLRARPHPDAGVLRRRQGAPEDRRDHEGRFPEDGIANKPHPGSTSPARRTGRRASRTCATTRTSPWPRPTSPSSASTTGRSTSSSRGRAQGEPLRDRARGRRAPLPVDGRAPTTCRAS